MFKKLLLIPACVACLLLFSCQKETSIDSTVPTGDDGGNGGGGGDLIGDWKLVQMHLKAETIAEVTGGGGPDAKTITKTEYYTKNNTGTVTFTADKITYSNYSYSIDTVVIAETFVGGISIGTLNMAVQETIPPSSGSSDYTKIGTDSLYSPSGFANMGGAGAVATQPSGARYKIVNDTLTLTSPVAVDFTEVIQGSTVKTKHTGVAETTLVRL